MLETLARAIKGDPGSAADLAVRSPRLFLSAVRGRARIPRDPGPELSNVFADAPVPDGAVSTYLDELRDDPRVHGVHRRLASVSGYGGLRQFAVPTRCLGLYVLVRHHEPETLVETGSFFGHSTCYLLLALERNGAGELHTFDVHPHEIGWHPPYLPPDFELGYAVPDELRDRWTLHYGRVEETLEPGLEGIGTIDLFFHDSDHSDSHKRFEFDLATRHLSADGILASHDVGHGNPHVGNPPTRAFLDAADSLDAEVFASRDFEPGDDGPSVFGYCYVSDPT